MNKNAIIDLLVSDLKDIQTLVETFRNADYIPKDFIDLLEQKSSGLTREVKLLNYWVLETDKQSGPKSAELVAVVNKAKSVVAATTSTKQNKPKESTSEKPTSPTMETGIINTPLIKDEDIVRTNKKNIAASSDISTSTEKQIVTNTQVSKTKPTVHQKPKHEVPSAPAKSEKPIRQIHATDIATYGIPVDDIRRAIGINDRYLFIRTLFANDNAAFDGVLNKINTCGTIDEALDFIHRSFSWDETDPVTEAFIKAIHRRFL